eukprot:XP_011240947.2 PREDICTED: transcription factor BTF3 homolog 4-like [Mus musculus]
MYGGGGGGGGGGLRLSWELKCRKKMSRCQAQVLIDGKGTAHRKKVVHRTAAADEKNTVVLLKEVRGIEEVNTFTNQGTVVHFNNPKVQASLAANTFTIAGHAETKRLTAMLASILNQLRAEGLTSFRSPDEALPKQSTDRKAPLAPREEEEDGVPDLVENFDDAFKNKANGKLLERGALVGHAHYCDPGRCDSGNTIKHQTLDVRNRKRKQTNDSNSSV